MNEPESRPSLELASFGPVPLGAKDPEGTRLKGPHARIEFVSAAAAYMDLK